MEVIFKDEKEKCFFSNEDGLERFLEIIEKGVLNEGKTYKINGLREDYTVIVTRLKKYIDKHVENPENPEMMFICKDGFYTLSGVKFTDIFLNMTPCTTKLVEKPQFVFSEKKEED